MSSWTLFFFTSDTWSLEPVPRTILPCMYPTQRPPKDRNMYIAINCVLAITGTSPLSEDWMIKSKSPLSQKQVESVNGWSGLNENFRAFEWKNYDNIAYTSLSFYYFKHHYVVLKRLHELICNQLIHIFKVLL